MAPKKQPDKTREIVPLKGVISAELHIETKSTKIRLKIQIAVLALGAGAGFAAWIALVR